LVTGSFVGSDQFPHEISPPYDLLAIDLNDDDLAVSTLGHKSFKILTKDRGIEFGGYYFLILGGSKRPWTRWGIRALMRPYGEISQRTFID